MTFSCVTSPNFWRCNFFFSSNCIDFHYLLSRLVFLRVVYFVTAENFSQARSFFTYEIVMPDKPEQLVFEEVVEVLNASVFLGADDDD